MRKRRYKLIYLSFLVQLLGCSLPFFTPRIKPAADLRITNSLEVIIDGANVIDRSPDGRWLIVYKNTAPPDSQLCVYSSDKLSPKFCLPGSDGMGVRLQPVSWSPDSSKLALVEHIPNIPIDTDIWVLTIETAYLENITEDHISGILSVDMENIPFLDIAPAWSPDSIWVAFARTIFHEESNNPETTLYKIPALGGEAERISKVSDHPGALNNGKLAWLLNDNLIYTLQDQNFSDSASGLHSVQVSGDSPPQALEILGEETLSSNLLTISPDSAYALLAHQIQTTDKREYTQIMVHNLETGETLPVKKPAPNQTPTWFSRSHLVTFSPDSSKIAYFYASSTPRAQMRLALVDIGGSDEVVIKTFDDRDNAIDFPLLWGQDDALMIKLVQDDLSSSILLLTVK